MEISKDKLVKIHYTGTLNDGTVFDSSEGKEPLEFIHGIGMIIRGLENEVTGLKVGDKKKIDIKANDAYGPVMEQAVQEVPKDQFPADMEITVGMQLAAQGPQGVIPVTIKEIKDNSVLVDFNHPLAGKDLTFDVEIVDVKEPTDEEKAKFYGPETSDCCGSESCDDDCSGNGSCKN